MEYTRFRTDWTRSSRSAAFAWLSCHFNLSIIHKRFTGLQCIAMHCNAVQSPTPISLEFARSTGRYTRVHTRWPSDPLIPAHQRCYAFAIALAHSIFHTQHDSIHRFAESCHGSNLHSTLLYPTFNYIDGYYNLQTHQYHSHSHFHSESPTWRFTTTSFHPTRHLLFILPLSQPHLLSFLILLLFWTNGMRSRFNLCGRHYSYPFLLSSFRSLLVQPYPSSSHTPFTRLKTNTPHSFQTKASQTLSFAKTKETVCEASTSILCACGYTLTMTKDA